MQANWYEDPIYESYWSTYSQTAEWCQRHVRASRAISEYYSRSTSWSQRQTQRSTSRFRDSRASTAGDESTDVYTDDTRRAKDDSKFRKRKKKSKRSRRKTPIDSKHRLKSRFSDPNDSQFEMEITPAMMEFFEESARHKQARKNRSDEESRSESNKPISSDSESEVFHPADKIQENRALGMRELYGDRAPMIRGMETAIQLSFDRNCDMKQPSLWPNIPLNMKWT